MFNRAIINKWLTQDLSSAYNWYVFERSSQTWQRLAIVWLSRKCFDRLIACYSRITLIHPTRCHTWKEKQLMIAKAKKIIYSCVIVTTANNFPWHSMWHIQSFYINIGFSIFHNIAMHHICKRSVTDEDEWTALPRNVASYNISLKVLYS